MALTIRSVRDGDIPRLLEIYAPYVEETYISFEFTPPTLEEFTRRINAVREKFPCLLAEENGEIVVDGYVSAFIDTGKDIFVRGVPEALDDPDDRPEMDMCLWYWIDTEKEITYGPYESAQALEEAADAQGVYVPAPESWTETYPAPSGARYD